MYWLLTYWLYASSNAAAGRALSHFSSRNGIYGLQGSGHFEKPVVHSSVGQTLFSLGLWPRQLRLMVFGGVTRVLIGSIPMWKSATTQPHYIGTAPLRDLAPLWPTRTVTLQNTNCAQRSCRIPATASKRGMRVFPCRMYVLKGKSPIRSPSLEVNCQPIIVKP